VSYPPAPEARPRAVIEAGPYRARFAESLRDLLRVQELRYRVFNLELKEGFDVSHETQRDADAFDPHCHHLMVEHVPSDTVVGTYRLQTGAMARAGAGYYTDGEYDLSALPADVLATGVELGRACIEREHRGRNVLFLLWKGLARYVAHNRTRWFFGCCSLTSQDPTDGWTALAQLEGRDGVWPQIRVDVRPAFACAKPVFSVDPGALKLPPLFEIYLRYGGKICSPPAIDREFKTIDLLMLFDVERLDERARDLFFEPD
jgi:putative hemolysin